MKFAAHDRVKSFLRIFLIGFATAMMCGRLSAQITYIGHFKVTTYLQTNTSVPTAPSGYYCGITLNSDSNYGISLPMVFTTSDSNPEFTFNETGPTNYAYAGPAYTNKDDFDADYPNSTYDYFIDYTGPTNSVPVGEDVYLQLPAEDIYSPSIPAFTPETWNGFSAVDPSQDFGLEWVDFTPGPNANPAISHTFIDTYDNQTFNGLYGGFNFDCVPGITSTVIPAGSLDYGRTYGINLFYSDRQSPDLTNSDGSPIFTIIGFDNLVTAYLTTLPPCLQISQVSATSVQLSWPTLATNNYQLETTRDLNFKNWYEVTNIPTANGTNVTVCLPARHKAAYFRLAPAPPL